MAYRVRQGREFVTPPAGLSYTGQYVASAPLCSQSWTASPQVLIPDGLPWPDRLQAVSCTREGARRAIPSACGPRTQRELYDGATNRQLTRRPIFCDCVSGISDLLNVVYWVADAWFYVPNRAGCASL